MTAHVGHQHFQNMDSRAELYSCARNGVKKQLKRLREFGFGEVLVERHVNMNSQGSILQKAQKNTAYCRAFD